jgi:hypothetical protein
MYSTNSNMLSPEARIIACDAFAILGDLSLVSSRHGLKSTSISEKIALSLTFAVSILVLNLVSAFFSRHPFLTNVSGLSHCREFERSKYV